MHEQVEAWADRQTAQALLPKLIAKLILATNNSVKKHISHMTMLFFYPVLIEYG